MQSCRFTFLPLIAVAERVLDHLSPEDTTRRWLGSPGCGMTTFVSDLLWLTVSAEMALSVSRFDGRAQGRDGDSREN